MSTILDALRKAEAERSRGALPNPPESPLASSVPAPSAREAALKPMGRRTAAALTVGMIAALAWWSYGRQAPSAGPTAAAPLAPASLPATASAPSGTPPAAWVAQAIALPAPATAAPPTPPPPRPASPKPAPATPVPATPAAAAHEPAARVPTLAELPEAVRAALPPLAMAGLVWSEQSSSRFVMVDGQLLREGDTVAPDLVLERIGQRSLLLRWREQRFEKPYRP